MLRAHYGSAPPGAVLVLDGQMTCYFDFLWSGNQRCEHFFSKLPRRFRIVCPFVRGCQFIIFNMTFFCFLTLDYQKVNLCMPAKAVCCVIDNTFWRTWWVRKKDNLLFILTKNKTSGKTIKPILQVKWHSVRNVRFICITNLSKQPS